MEEIKSSKEEFAQAYMKNLFDYVLPEIKIFEKERISLFILLIFLYIILTVLAIGLLIFLSKIHIPGRALVFKWFIGIALLFLYGKISRPFEYKVKSKTVPVLVSAFDGFRWLEEASEEYYQDVLDSDVFPFYKNKKIEHGYNDYFYGNYSDVHMDFSQAYYCTETLRGKFEFSGCVIRIKMNKSFEGETIVRPKNVPFNEMKDLELEEVILEDVDFNKKFNVFSTDQVEARYLLTTSLMERIKDISVKFKGSGKILCSFNNDNIYIAIETKERMFSLFKLNHKVDKIAPFHEFFTQIASVIDLVDYLKLNQRTGL